VGRQLGVGVGVGRLHQGAKQGFLKFEKEVGNPTWGFARVMAIQASMHNTTAENDI